MTEEDQLFNEVRNTITNALIAKGILYVEYTEGEGIEAFYRGLRVRITIEKDNLKDMRG